MDIRTDANIPAEPLDPIQSSLSFFEQLSQIDFMKSIELSLMICLCVIMIFFLLPIPLQIKKSIILTIRKPSVQKYTTPIYRGFMIILIVLLCDSLRGLYVHNSNLIISKRTQVIAGSLPTVRQELESKLYLAQANFYLSSFNLFLLMIMHRLFSMQLKIANYEEEVNEAETRNKQSTISQTKDISLEAELKHA